MDIFLVNLVRRPDRLSAMTAQLKRLGLQFHRVPALDAMIVGDDWLARYFHESGPLGAMSKGDKCCFLSHQRAWSTFLSTGEPYGVILEDDVALDPSAGDLLRSSDWIPPATQLLKLEHFGPASQRVLLGRQVDVGDGRSVAEIHSRHTGAAAYIIGRETAQLLLSHTEKRSVSVDHLLFNANVSPIARCLRPYQLLPVIARQTTALGGNTDIDGWRAAQRRLSWSYICREVRRAYYDIRLLPLQIWRVLAGGDSLVCVRNDALIRAMTRTARMSAADAGRAKHGVA
jgi:glycosyl transferase, family 25